MQAQYGALHALFYLILMICLQDYGCLHFTDDNYRASQ